MSQLRQMVFADGSIRHGILPAGSAGGGDTYLPTGRRSPQGEGKNGKEFAYREYTKVYNRLKTWKYRGKLNAEDWNRKVAYIQDVKAAFLAGGMSDAEYLEKLKQI